MFQKRPSSELPRHKKFINKALNSEQVAVEIVWRAVQIVTIHSPLAVGEGISCIETNHALHTHTQDRGQGQCCRLEENMDLLSL